MLKRWFASGMIITLILLLAVGCAAETPSDAGEVAQPQSTTVQESAEEPTLPPPVITETEGTIEGNPPVSEEETASEPPAEPAEEMAEEAVEVVEPKTPWPSDQFGYGIQVHGNATVGDPGDTMHTVRDQLGMDWVKMQIQWWLIHPDPDVDQWFFYDAVVEQAAEHNLRLLVSVVGAPAWTRADGTENGPPDDYGQYAAFLTEMLERYDGKIDAVEVWNEQNLDREWATANGVNPEDYVRFLQVASEAIKAYDPNMIVISGALSPAGGGDWVSWIDDFQWLDRALAAGMLDYVDCVGAHHNGYNIGPSVTYEEAPSSPEAATAIFRGPFDNPHHSWSFKSTLDTYAEKVQAVNPAMKLCVTEFGWASSEGYDTYPTGFEFAQDNTLQEQADYIVQAFQQMHDSGNVWLAYLFNFDFGNKGSGPEDDPVPYSIIDTQGIPRPAFNALTAMNKTS
ncbi:MAG: hypothetical protein ACK2UK_01095 [Candidatus Promineifilaceae bacterium]